MTRLVNADPKAPAEPSLVRAWFYLVGLCLQRQARSRQMVWIALALLAFSAALVGLNTLAGRWTMAHWRWRPPEPDRARDLAEQVLKEAKKGEGKGPPRRPETFGKTLEALESLSLGLPGPSPAVGLLQAHAGSGRALLDQSGFAVFSTWMLFSIFMGFLLPLWSLSFATEALGGEREARTLGWLLTRPLPRPSIYLAKFFGLLPWSMGLNLSGFALLCWLAGPPGHKAMALFWPAVLWGTLAYCALFHLMSALFRRAGIIAIVYSFFFETLVGSMPGMMKRASVSFYTRCLMFDAAADYGLAPQNPGIYLPVSGSTALAVLVGVTVVLLAAGMHIFARTEYQELS